MEKKITEVPPNLTTEMFMMVASFMLKSTVPKFEPEIDTDVPPCWKREFKLPWREAGPPNHHDAKVESDQ